MPYFQSPHGQIYFEQHGSRAATPILMIHGIGCQVIHWPESVIKGLVDAEYRVIVFDNRDTGLSFSIESPPPEVADLIAAQNDPTAVEAAYSLSDMADDTVHLLNHIGQSGAHVVGVSMGGMIAQRLALNHGKRVFSLTVIMSSTSNPELPDAAPEAVGALAQTFFLNDRQAVIDSTIAAGTVLGGEHFDSRTEGIARFAEKAFDRAFNPQGTLRQFAAILTDGNRAPLLIEIKIPVLAIHGDNDPLVHPSASNDIINSVPEGKLLTISKLGHDLPESVVPQVVSAIVDHISATTPPR